MVLQATLFLLAVAGMALAVDPCAPAVQAEDGDLQLVLGGGFVVKNTAQQLRLLSTFLSPSFSFSPSLFLFCSPSLLLSSSFTLLLSFS